MVFLALYVDDIFLIGNEFGVLSSMRVWLLRHSDRKILVKSVIFSGSRQVMSIVYHPFLAWKFLRNVLYISNVEYLFLRMIVDGQLIRSSK